MQQPSILSRIAAGALALLVITVPVAAQETTPAAFKNLKYRPIGPAAGGRVCRVAGVPGDPLVYYAATASGGLWKSADGGLSWKAVTDSQSVCSIGSVAVAPSNPNIIYIGAGEANIRGNVVTGNGIYKSTDAGKTWTQVWKQEGQIGTMVVHPTNPDIAFAAVLGHAFGPNPERGVYRTTDGGKNWKQILAKNSDTGASDVCLDPSNPLLVFAGMWQARRQPWELTSGGPGSGLYVSRDGGETWKSLGPEDGAEPPKKGLPKSPWGKVGVAVAPSDGRRVYALIEAEKGGLYRSDDGGDTWTLASADQNLRQRAWYYSTITVDPKIPDIVWCPNVSLYKSIDGGKTFRAQFGPHHGDHHDLWIDPLKPSRMINGNDGGVDITTNGGESWYAPPLPIAQFYHVAVDSRVPYHVSGAMQDLGTASGPSNSLAAGGIAPTDWHSVGGGEAGFTASDPSDPDIVYAGEYGGYISRYDHKTRQVRNISAYPVSAVGKGGEELTYRFQWTAPILISPHDPKVLYHGGNVLFKTSDGGTTWTAISPDLTTNDKSKQKWSGGPITGDNTGAEIYCTIFALAESPKQKDLLWVGTDDGNLHLTHDGGKTWDLLNVRGFPKWGTVVCIEPSPFDAGTAYVVVDAHRLDDMRPYLFTTTDFGKTWKELSSRLAPNIILHAVRTDPRRQGMLYLGTDRGVAFSPDDGATWHQLKLNLPTVPVHDLVVKDRDLVIGTHGRSIWILDDLTPVREMTPQIAGEEVHFFPVGEATRFRYHRGFSGRGAEANPPRGAIVHYYLKSKPKGEISLEIVDTQGAKVATLSSKADNPSEESTRSRSRLGGGATVLPMETGINRATWDLSYAGPTTIPGAMAWPGAASVGPMVLPGTYTLRLKVDGKTQAQTVVVHADRRVEISTAELNEQLKIALALRDHISNLSGKVKQMRAVKQQLVAKNELWKADPKAESLLNLSKDLLAKLDTLEGKLHNPNAKIPYDLLRDRGGAKLYSQFNNLYSALLGSDGAPTQGVREMVDHNVRELKQLEVELKALINGDLAQINEVAKKMDIPNVVVPEGEKKP